MSGYFIDASGMYYEGDPYENSQAVTQRPSPDYAWVSGSWVNQGLMLRGMGSIPTNVFISNVFAPPSGTTNPPPDYTWNRENTIRQLLPAVSVRMPKGQNIMGTRADIMQLSQYAVSHGYTPNTLPIQYTTLSPVSGSYVGGIISQEEYNRVAPLLDQYGVK